jgi:SAM-dependent methyltransferase
MVDSIYPKSFSRFYDVVYGQIRNIDQDFYVRKMVACSGPTLEIGSGTGRMLSRALEEGADAYGLEPSPHMNDACRAKLKPKDQRRVFEGMVQTMDLGLEFDLIVAPFRVFQHFMTQEDQLAALTKIEAHLKPGGRLIFDAFKPDPKLLAMGKVTKKDFDGEWKRGCKLERYVTSDPDALNKQVDVSFKLRWQEEPEGDWEADTWSTALHLYDEDELRQLVGLSPLKLEKICGDLEEGGLLRRVKNM